jgi:5-methylcytosine-specific restriction endonuclease McrA
MNAEHLNLDLPIGKLVKASVPSILESCADDPAELGRLQDPTYCHEVFGLNFPFMRPAAGISGSEAQRYWRAIYSVAGVDVRVTSQWYVRNRVPFLAYMAGRGIISGTYQAPTPATRVKRGDARYKQTPIGNAQNLLIRHVLGRLGNAPFTQADWLRTIESFNSRCAYCGEANERLEREHAIAMNKQDLGEHHLGNIVPSCKECNSQKGDKSYRTFLEAKYGVTAAAEPIARIDRHMEEHGYAPLTPGSQIVRLLVDATNDLAQIAQDCIEAINALHESEVDRGMSV